MIGVIVKVGDQSLAPGWNPRYVFANEMKSVTSIHRKAASAETVEYTRKPLAPLTV